MGFHGFLSRIRRQLPALATGLLAVGAMTAVAAPAQAALMFFDNRADFELASGLSGITEDFEEANISPGNVSPNANPLSAITNDGIFSSGDIASGLSVSASAGSLSTLGEGVAGTTKMVGAVFAPAELSLSFGPTATAIGFDLFSTFLGGGSDDFQIQLFSDTGTLLGSTNASGVNRTTATFFGVISSTDAVARVNIQGVQATEVIDNITFGNAVAQLAEPGTLALFGLGLLGIGAAARRRQR